MDFILGQLISLTNLIHIIPGQFVNKPFKDTFFSLLAYFVQDISWETL